MRCGFWRFSASTMIGYLLLSCAAASEPVVVNTVNGAWFPASDVQHFVFVPDTPSNALEADVTVQQKSLVFLPKGAEMVVVEPQVYGVPNLSSEVSKHYTWDFIVYLGWLLAFGGVLASK